MPYLKTIITLIKNKNYHLILLKLMSRVSQFGTSDAERKNSQLFDDEKFDEFITSSDHLEKNETIDPSFYQKKAIAYFRLGHKNEAHKTMEKALEEVINEKTDHFISQVEDLIFDPLRVESSYAYLGGYNNLGVVIHHDLARPDCHYITKIAKNIPAKRHSIKKEIIFNDLIRKTSPLLQSLTPEMIANQDYAQRQVKLLTFEKKGRTLIDDFEIDLSQVLALNHLIIDSTAYGQTWQLLKDHHGQKFLNPEMKFHEKITHDIIAQQMIQSVKQVASGDDLLPMIAKIKALILDRRLYQKINPAKDYVLCHGDFNPANITYDQASNHYFLIDWENYGFSLKGYDLANYLSMSDLSFAKIKKDLVPDFFPLGDQEMIAKLFFTYQLLVKWISHLKKENEASQLKTNILPAIKDLTKAIEKI